MKRFLAMLLAALLLTGSLTALVLADETDDEQSVAEEEVMPETEPEEEPVDEEPVVEEPVVEEPVVEEPVDEEPVDEEPVVEESVVEEPVVEEPVVEEPVVEEPVVEEPVVDEPVVDEPVVDEPVVDEPAIEEPVVEEPVVEEPVKVTAATFVEGYVWVNDGAKAYQRPALEDEAGVFTARSAVFAQMESREASEGESWLRVTLDTADLRAEEKAPVTAYVQWKNIKPLTQEEGTALEEALEQDWAARFFMGRAVPVAQFQPKEEEAPAEPAEEAEPVADEPETIPEATEPETIPEATEPEAAPQPIEITAQPESVTAPEGETVTFAVTAENAAEYQWQFSKDGALWFNISASSVAFEGAQTGALSFQLTADRAAEQYRCVLTGAAGSVETDVVSASIAAEAQPEEAAADPAAEEPAEEPVEESAEETTVEPESEAVVDDPFTYSEGECLITGYTGTEADIVLPEFSADGRPVTGIAANAFKDNAVVGSVVVPAHIETIGESAFEGCVNLTRVVLTESVQTIGNRAFFNCLSLVEMIVAG